MIDPAIVDRLREAAAGYPNPIVNDTAIVRRADLRALLEATVAAQPAADALLIRAVDRLMVHGHGCPLPDCATCDAGYNQVRLAYKVWTNSQAKAAPPAADAEAPDQCLSDLLDAYRRKRAVDGLNARDWDGAVHWKAEQDIEQLERRYAALHPERHLADAETPP